MLSGQELSEGNRDLAAQVAELEKQVSVLRQQGKGLQHDLDGSACKFVIFRCALVVPRMSMTKFICCSLHSL